MMRTARAVHVLRAKALRDPSPDLAMEVLREEERNALPLDCELAVRVRKVRHHAEAERLLTLALRQCGALDLPEHPRKRRATGTRSSCRARGVILEGQKVGPRKACHEGDGYRRKYLALVAPGVAVRFVSRWIREPGTIAYVQGRLEDPKDQLDLLPGSVFHVFEPFGRDLLALRLKSARSLLGCGLPNSMNCYECDGWGTRTIPGEPGKLICAACRGRGRDPRAFAAKDASGNWILPVGATP